MRIGNRDRGRGALQLRVGEEGRHSTRPEHFFDLAFAIAIAALAGMLHDLTPGSFLAFAVLFVRVGWT